MENVKILIVDDDMDLTKALQVTFESKQYIVVAANSKIEGMEKIKSEKPDLAILDVMMYGADNCKADHRKTSWKSMCRKRRRRRHKIQTNSA